jgi:hypothetical protein
VASAQDRLADVDAAIEAVMKAGQAYRLLDGTEVTRANLETLRRMRQEIVADVTAADQGGLYRRISFGRAGGRV